MAVYVDTSALAKWYLNEVHSEAFEAYLMETGPVDISSLTALEMRSLLARRRHDGSIDAPTEMQVFAVFQEDIARGYLHLYPLQDEHTHAAIRLISSLPDHSLRSLDALHIAIAQSIAAPTLVTADRVMANAAEDLAFEVVRFD